MTPDLKNIALVAFLDGKTHRQIAAELTKSKSTITRWSVKYRWLERRNEAYRAALDEVQLNNQVSTVKSTSNNLAAIDDILKTAIAEQSAYEQGKILRKQRKFSIADIVKLTIAVSNLNNASYYAKAAKNEKA